MPSNEMKHYCKGVWVTDEHCDGACKLPSKGSLFKAMIDGDVITCAGITMPKDVYIRGQRLIRKYGRTNYFEQWYTWQLAKQLLEKA